MSEKDMSNFDWVTNRSDCSLAKAYETLKLRIQEDVAIRKKLHTLGEPCRFEVLVNGDSFTVLKEGHQIRETVTFVLTDKAIEVRDKRHNVIFEATVTLSDDGECRLSVAGQEREFWQVRMMALENLFFGSR
jgi:hypothetical protein